MSQRIKDILDLNTTNFVLGKASAILAFVQLHTQEKNNNEIENNFIVLPYGTYHHTNYEYHFKGTCVENLNPIIHTQNKEFLDICINTSADVLGIVSYDFNIVQLSVNEETKELEVVKSFTKKEAQEILKKKPDYRFTDF